MFLFDTHLVRSAVRTVVGWLDDRGQAPIMRQHINDGTHRFLADEDEYRGMTAVDDVLSLGVVPREDDDGDPPARVDRNASLPDLQLQYVAANKRTVIFVVAASLSIVALVGMNGVGPLSSLARIVAGAGRSLFIGAGVVAGLSCWRVAQSAVRAVRLHRILRQRRLSG